MNFEQFFDDVISGHNDIIGCWFFTASKFLGWSWIILKNWGHSTYQYYVTFSESDPSFRFSQMKKSWKMNLFDRSNPCFRVSRYRWIRWWYQIFDILNIGTFRFLKLKGPNKVCVLKSNPRYTILEFLNSLWMTLQCKSALSLSKSQSSWPKYHWLLIKQLYRHKNYFKIEFCLVMTLKVELWVPNSLSGC